jgi:hypothetical protein
VPEQLVLDLVRKTASFFEFSLCLSRACLGKMIVFTHKWLKNAVFRSGKSIGGGAYPNHYAAWNCLGCPGAQMDEGYQNMRGCDQFCFRLWLCVKKLVVCLPATAAAIGGVVTLPLLVISLPIWQVCGDSGPTLGLSRNAQQLTGQSRFTEEERCERPHKKFLIQTFLMSDKLNSAAEFARSLPGACPEFARSLPRVCKLRTARNNQKPNLLAVDVSGINCIDQCLGSSGCSRSSGRCCSSRWRSGRSACASASLSPLLPSAPF